LLNKVEKIPNIDKEEVSSSSSNNIKEISDESSSMSSARHVKVLFAENLRKRQSNIGLSNNMLLGKLKAPSSKESVITKVKQQIDFLHEMKLLGE
jgi:hypothetical protein